MADSLRDAVKVLAAAWRQTAEQMASFSSSGANPARRLVVCANELESAIARHPPVDEAVVPVAKFTDQQVSEWMERHGLEAHPESDMRCAMDDAASLLSHASDAEHEKHARSGQ
jgi:hypothetical protein